MTVLVNLEPAQEEILRRRAEVLGVPADELVRVAVLDFLERGEGDFKATALRLLEANRELYRRLAS
jgi:hypothetical protein